MAKPVIGIIMGADKDLPVMSEAAMVLDEFNVPYEVRIISAHRTPEIMETYAAEAQTRGLKVIIAGAGGSAHLPGMTASHTLLPVLAVPIKAPTHDHEALWSNIKMPTFVPLATMPENGARNAALMAIEILALNDPALVKKYANFRKKLHDGVVNGDKNLQQLGWKDFLKSIK
jgi:phosphoribosylaminoimidazole carboxylase PurE protein